MYLYYGSFHPHLCTSVYIFGTECVGVDIFATSNFFICTKVCAFTVFISNANLNFSPDYRKIFVEYLFLLLKRQSINFPCKYPPYPTTAYPALAATGENHTSTAPSQLSRSLQSHARGASGHHNHLSQQNSRV
jgi:hypothetical protein